MTLTVALVLIYLLVGYGISYEMIEFGIRNDLPLTAPRAQYVIVLTALWLPLGLVVFLLSVKDVLRGGRK